MTGFDTGGFERPWGRKQEKTARRACSVGSVQLRMSVQLEGPAKIIDGIGWEDWEKWFPSPVPLRKA